MTGWPDQKVDDVFGNDGTPVDELDKLAKRKKHFNNIDKLRGIYNPINDLIEAEEEENNHD